MSVNCSPYESYGRYSYRYLNRQTTKRQSHIANNNAHILHNWTKCGWWNAIKKRQLFFSGKWNSVALHKQWVQTIIRNSHMIIIIELWSNAIAMTCNNRYSSGDIRSLMLRTPFECDLFIAAAVFFSSSCFKSMRSRSFDYGMAMENLQP